MKIGFRTLKTAVGVSLSVLIAQSLHLNYFTAAGILTLLCIQKSRKQSVRAAFSRLCACLSSLVAASLLFEAIGYHPYAFLLFLLLFIPYCVRLGIQEGIASSSVIVMHVYMHHGLALSFFANEIQVILIGLGVALLVNWYMPSNELELTRYKDEIDGLVTGILMHISCFLKEGDLKWDGKELIRLPKVLEQARRAAVLDTENKPLFHSKDKGYETYFEIKREQYEILERMLPSLSRVTLHLEQGTRLGEFVEEMNACLSNHIYTMELADKLQAIREHHKQLPLPETREEFENRASLFAVANELERFLVTIRKLGEEGLDRSERPQPRNGLPA